MRSYDVVIAGAGPAGSSAALILARARRRVLLCDTGTPRSWASHRMYSYLSRDGIPPARFRQLSRAQLARYPDVVYKQVEVLDAKRMRDGRFAVSLADRRIVASRKLLIATGLFDNLPPIKGIDELFGRSVFQCPYCDGWETRDQRIAVYGRGNRGLEMARAMTAWASDIALCTDGRARYDGATLRQIDRNGIRLIEKRVDHLDGSRGKLRAVVFADGETIARDALYFDAPSRSQSQLARKVGCQFTQAGGILCGRYEATSVPGVFAAGNIIRDVQLSIVAAAEGARAAFGINRALTREDFDRHAR
ncbi:MAG: NAD(P)/FAD-dependent oxidoreductase [Pseudomonadota bacterium]